MLETTTKSTYFSCEEEDTNTGDRTSNNQNIKMFYKPCI